MTLKKQIRDVFHNPAARTPDVYRKPREQAKKLAAAHGIELEKIDSGHNVWPPKGMLNDPYDGDHYAPTWVDVLHRVKKYVESC